NFDRYRPEYLLDLTRVSDLAQWALDNGRIRLGAGVSYTRVITELGDRLPGLAMASRTVGSPQIRNRGTVGGNLGAASPAGDSHPAPGAGGGAVPRAVADRRRPVGVARRPARRHQPALRRPGRGGRLPHRRRTRDRTVPRPLPVRHGPARADLGVERLPEGV